MKVFYHNDLDGEASARIIEDAFYAEKEFITMDYEKEFPFDVLKDNEQVYIVDFSIEPSEMKDLLEITNNVVWIDHHKTAIKKYKDFPIDIPGIREVGRAGCELTHEYIRKDLGVDAKDFNTFLGIEEGKHYPTGEDINYVKLIGDWDVWRFDFGDTTREFHYGLLGKDTHPKSSFWHQVKTPQSLNNYIEIGREVLNYENKKSKEYVERFGFETTWKGHDLFVINKGNINSMAFGDKIDDYDICAGYAYNGEEYIVSLYSKKVDTSEISASFGGGGHAGASGFIVDTLPF